MMAYSVFAICYIVANRAVFHLEATDSSVHPHANAWFWFQFFSVFLKNATFNYAYWQFAWTYYTISRYTPILLKNETPS
jgi:hypothetical protein